MACRPQFKGLFEAEGPAKSGIQKMVIVEHECLSGDNDILKDRRETVLMKMGNDEMGCAAINSISSKTRTINDDYYTERVATGNARINGKTEDVETNLAKWKVNKFNKEWEAKWDPKLKGQLNLRELRDLKLGEEQKYEGSLREQMGLPRPDKLLQIQDEICEVVVDECSPEVEEEM